MVHLYSWVKSPIRSGFQWTLMPIPALESDALLPALKSILPRPCSIQRVSHPDFPWNFLYHYPSPCFGLSDYRLHGSLHNISLKLSVCYSSYVFVNDVGFSFRFCNNSNKIPLIWPHLSLYLFNQLIHFEVSVEIDNWCSRWQRRGRHRWWGSRRENYLQIFSICFLF